VKLFAEFLTEWEAKSVAGSPPAVEPEPAPVEPVEEFPEGTVYGEWQGVVAWTGLLAKVPTREARILSRDHASGPRAAIVCRYRWR